MELGTPHKKILEDEGLTFAEKLLSIKRIDEPSQVAHAGNLVVGKADLSMATDGTGPLAIKVFGDMGADKLWNPEKVLLVIDHTYPASSDAIASLHKLMREFATKQGCALHEGSICHQYMLERYDSPGMLIIGADSHTTTGGSVGAFATGVGSTEMAAVWASGSLWLKVPDSIKIAANGDWPKGVYAKDLVLSVIGKIGLDGASYRCVEWTGSAVKKLTISSRATLTNMGMEMGAKAAIVEEDATTDAYLKSMGRKAEITIHAGKEAEYVKVIEMDVDELEPVVAAPSSPANLKTITDVEGTPIDQAFLGSCTNARLEDLEVAARIIKGRKVKDGCRFIVTPASRAVYEEALRRGLMQIFAEAGGVVTSSTCGACVGTHCGILAPAETCVSSSNRNFVGRMGARESSVYLASPATVAASAIEGAIADPRKYL